MPLIFVFSVKSNESIKRFQLRRKTLLINLGRGSNACPTLLPQLSLQTKFLVGQVVLMRENFG
jgi:hypothetical protein